MKCVSLRVVRTTLLSASLVAALGACNRTPPTDAPPASAAGVPASTASASPGPGYTRPTAEQLYALVSPIALFPDKLVALTLAGSTHPDQIDAARGFLTGNRNLDGGALVDAADAQPWDPSVKSLVAFPGVLDQLATNREWTAALGDAYANDPTDVMNAIQVMRDRARTHGALTSSSQQVVQVDETRPGDDDDGVPPIVRAPTRTIVIESAQQDVVYVPQYDPDEVYGEPVYSSVYRTHWYPAPANRGEVVTAGLVSFGAGILVGQIFASHDRHDGPHGGWNAWNTSWGRGPRDGGDRGRPAVVYDNHPYVVNRTTINRTTIDRSVHIDNRHDNGNVAPPRPDFEHMQRPNFTPAMGHATAENARPALPPQARPDEGPRPQPHAAQPRQEPAARAPSEPRPHMPPEPQPAARPHPDARPPSQARPQPQPRPPQQPQQHNEAPHERPAPPQHTPPATHAQPAQHPQPHQQPQHEQHAPPPRHEHDKHDN